MSRGKIFKKSYRNVLYLAISVFVAIALLIALSATSLAKYISSQKKGDSAGVAGMGIKVFELIEHGSHGEEDDAEYTEGQIDLKYDCEKIIPGVDIPGPHIKLKIDSAVSCALYVKVNVPKVDCIKFGDGEPTKTQTVTYKIDSKWALQSDLTQEVSSGDTVYTVYTYKYEDVFNPATEYNHTKDGTGALGEIPVLDGDVIKISQYYKSSSEFTLTFNAYIKQVLS